MMGEGGGASAGAAAGGSGADRRRVVDERQQRMSSASSSSSTAPPRHNLPHHHQHPPRMAGEKKTQQLFSLPSTIHDRRGSRVEASSSADVLMSLAARAPDPSSGGRATAFAEASSVSSSSRGVAAPPSHAASAAALRGFRGGPASVGPGVTAATNSLSRYAGAGAGAGGAPPPPLPPSHPSPSRHHRQYQPHQQRPPPPHPTLPLSARVASAHLASGENVLVRVRLQNEVLVTASADSYDDGGEEKRINHHHRRRVGEFCGVGVDPSSRANFEGTVPTMDGAVTDDSGRGEEGYERNAFTSIVNDGVHPRPDHGFHHQRGIASGGNNRKDREFEETNSSLGGGSEDDFPQNHSVAQGGENAAGGPCASTREAASALASASASARDESRQQTAATGGVGDGAVADGGGFNYADPTLLLGLLDGGGGNRPSSSPNVLSRPLTSVDGLNEPSPKTAKRSSASHLGGCTTIPNGMDSFLDALNNEQRSVRHRHVPTAEGFRRLYKSEIRRDLATARKSFVKAAKRGLPSSSGGGAGEEAAATAEGESTPALGGDSATDAVDRESLRGEVNICSIATGSDNNDADCDAASGSGDDDAAEDDECEYERNGDLRRRGVDRGPPPHEAFFPPPDDIVALADRAAAGGTPPVASLDENAPRENQQLRLRNGAHSSGGGAQPPAAPTSSLSSSSSSNHNAADPTAVVAPQSALFFLRSPRSVESICVFDPPRPQESVGSKKRHRMKRWEYHPHDVEVDLANYRKTVVRTRVELHRAEDERVRIEVTASHLRDHLVRRNAMLREECARAERELRGLQLACAEAAGLHPPNNKAGGGGAAPPAERGSRAVGDALSVLKSRGEEAFRLPTPRPPRPPHRAPPRDWRVPGVGGVRTSPDDDRVYAPSGGQESAPPPGERSSLLSAGWLLPGDGVITPAGEGIVVLACGPSSGPADAVDTIGGFPEEIATSSAAAAGSGNRHGFGSVGGGKTAARVGPPLPVAALGARGRKKNGKITKKKKVEGGLSPAAGAVAQLPELPSSSPCCELRLLPERVCVRLSFGGLAYFHPRDVRFKGFPPSPCFSDGELKNRWEKMTETAKLMGTRHDFAGIDDLIASHLMACAGDEGGGNDRQGAGADGAGEPEFDGGVSSGADRSLATSKKRMNSVLPFGAGLLAAPVGIKNTSSSLSVQLLEKMTREVLFEGGGAGAVVSIPKVTSNVRKIEARREELNQLRGKVMQLRNRLGRQKRIRTLNERSYIAGKHRAQKVEGLLMEMKSDLTNLKERLRDELLDLGIDTSRAAAMLAYEEKNDDNGTDDEGSYSKEDEHQEAEESLASNLIGACTDITTGTGVDYNSHFDNTAVGLGLSPHINRVGGSNPLSNNAFATARNLSGLNPTDEAERATKRARA